MLHCLEIENFYSIRKRQVIDLRIAGNAPDLSGRFGNIYNGSSERAPKVVAFFGPNASGKSTVLKALSYLAWFISNSVQLPLVSDLSTGFQLFNKFASDDATEPTRLVAHFTGSSDFNRAEVGKVPDSVTSECRYTYEVQFENRLERPRRVILESLRQWPNEGGKSIRIFEHQSGAFSANKIFDIAGYQKIINNLRPNVSLVSTLALSGHKPSILLSQMASSVISNIFIQKIDLSDDSVIKDYYENDQSLIEELNRNIERIDLGIRKMDIYNGINGAEAYFQHYGLSKPLPMFFESHGTRQFIRIFPILAKALRTGGIAIVDEIDQTIHPLLLPEIIRWFHDSERNPQNAQLWMSCHNPSLLEELVKEEIYFCEKSDMGETRVYGLQDIMSVRRSDNLYKKYMGGVYGAIPSFG
jgi:uncharacterized protein